MVYPLLNKSNIGTLNAAPLAPCHLINQWTEGKQIAKKYFTQWNSMSVVLATAEPEHNFSDKVNRETTLDLVNEWISSCLLYAIDNIRINRPESEIGKHFDGLIIENEDDENANRSESLLYKSMQSHSFSTIKIVDRLISIKSERSHSAHTATENNRELFCTISVLTRSEISVRI